MADTFHALDHAGRTRGERGVSGALEGGGGFGKTRLALSISIASAAIIRAACSGWMRTFRRKRCRSGSTAY